MIIKPPVTVRPAKRPGLEVSTISEFWVIADLGSPLGKNMCE
jgi:hypothetical protein